MKLYMAPMEGITGHIYRRAYFHYFDRIDRYYMPFLSSTGLNMKEIRDIAPENNEGMDVIPQILTNHTDIFLELAKMFQDLGYSEVNLNLGCPSGTVTAKGRGSGFLKYLPELRQFLDEICEKSVLPVSVKTRIGFESESEWPAILELLMDYPFTEMIIHPRLRQDMYKKPVRPEAYELATAEMERNTDSPETPDEMAKEPVHREIPLCYNGDLYTVQDVEAVRERFPKTERIMLGRGLIANPGLAGELRGEGPMKKSQLEGFLDEVVNEYRKIIPEEKNTLFRMLEIWAYLYRSFPDGERVLKRIRKCKNLAEYRVAVAAALEDF